MADQGVLLTQNEQDASIPPILGALTQKTEGNKKEEAFPEMTAEERMKFVKQQMHRFVDLPPEIPPIGQRGDAGDNPEDPDEFGYVPPIQDPYQRAIRYLEEHNILQLFQRITSGIVYKRPDDPIQYMIDEVQRRKEIELVQNKDRLNNVKNKNKTNKGNKRENGDAKEGKGFVNADNENDSKLMNDSTLANTSEQKSNSDGNKGNNYKETLPGSPLQRENTIYGTDTKDVQGDKDIKDVQEDKESKDVKEDKDSKDVQDDKDSKDVQDDKESKDVQDSEIKDENSDKTDADTGEITASTSQGDEIKPDESKDNETNLKDEVKESG